MKKIVSLLMAGSMAATLAACGGAPASSSAPASTAASSAAASTAASSAAPAASGALSADAFKDLAPVTISGADNASKGAAGNRWGLRVAELVEEITGGQMTVEYFGTGELGSDVDIANSVQAGDVDFQVTQPAPLVTLIPESAVFDLPMVFATSSYEQIDEALNGDGEFATAFKAAYESHNFTPVHFLQGATFRQTSVKADGRDFSTIAGFSGLKIRTMENSNHIAFWTALGAAPTPLTWGEVYTSLQQGLIAGQENATDTMVGANLQEVQDTLIRTNHLLYVNELLFNTEKFNSLDPLYQQAFQQAVDQAAAEIEAELPQVDKDNAKILTDAGMTEVTYEDSFFEEVLALDGVKKLYADIDTQVGGGLVALLQAALA